MAIMLPYISYEKADTACARLKGSSLMAPCYLAMRRTPLMGEGMQIKLWPHCRG